MSGRGKEKLGEGGGEPRREGERAREREASRRGGQVEGRVHVVVCAGWGREAGERGREIRGGGRDGGRRATGSVCAHARACV